MAFIKTNTQIIYLQNKHMNVLTRLTLVQSWLIATIQGDGSPIRDRTITPRLFLINLQTLCTMEKQGTPT